MGLANGQTDRSSPLFGTRNLKKQALSLRILEVTIIKLFVFLPNVFDIVKVDLAHTWND
jgi:hypothetical protein